MPGRGSIGGHPSRRSRCTERKGRSLSNDELGDVSLRDRVERAVDAAGNGYLAVSGELLVAREAADDAAQALADLARARQGRAGVRELGRGDSAGPVVRLSFANAEDLRRRVAAPVPEVLEGVRGLLAGRRAGAAARRAVSPNHVFVGEGFYSGGPADTVAAAPAMAVPSADAGAGVRVEVLDTGLFLGHSWWQPGAISAQSVEGVSEPSDDDGDGALDQQAGHGTFVAGIVAQQAPAAEIHTRAVLNSYGQADEPAIARALRDAVSDFENDPSARSLVINLSLGGYTEGDAAPLDILAALDTLPPEVVVVAAAGNDHPNAGRPFFPAALKRVLAVGALDADGLPAAFSNRGCWVDACSLGVGVGSSFFDGLPPPLQDFHGFAAWSGTSFAAPRVAGKIAAVLSGQLAPGAEPEVRHLLRRCGHPASAAFAASGAATLVDLGLVIP